MLHLLLFADNKRLFSISVALVEAPHEFTGPRVYFLSRESQESNGGKNFWSRSYTDSVGILAIENV